MTWHQGKNMVNDEDRLLIGLPTNFNSIDEAVRFLVDFKEES